MTTESPPAANGLLVEGRGLGVRRGGRWLLRHVDLRVERGQLVCLIGANGAGKTTAVKALLGLVPHDEGTVARAPRLKVGYSPQRLAIAPTLPLTLRRAMTLTGRFPASAIDSALADVGLDRLGDPPVTSLSGGEFQRLLLARSLVARPDLVVLDEPVQGVDTAGQDRLHTLILDIRKELGCGVLMVSHDIRLVSNVADDVVVLVPHEHDDAPAAAGEA